jgi:hypothetical protein
MVPFACIHCRTKRIKTNLTKEKEMKTEEKKKFFGDLKGPLAREPYGPPDPYIILSSTRGHQTHTDINYERNGIIRGVESIPL